MGFRGRHRNKRDANEAPIVDAFRAMGVTVERLDKPVDLLCLCAGRARLVEVKGEGVKADPRQTAQNEFLSQWPVTVVRSVEDVRETVAEWRSEAAHD